MKILDLKIINNKIELEIEDKRRMEIFSIFISIEEFQNLILKFKFLKKNHLERSYNQ